MSENDGGGISGVEDLIETLEAENSALDAYGEIVERCIIHAENMLTIWLQCGLEFSESIERAVR
jgi:hypothetical protein